MAWPLFKANIKSIRTIWIIMILVFFMYFAIYVSIYDPEGPEALEEMMKALPEGMLKALGFELGATMLSFLSGSMYGLLVFLFPMVVSIVVNHGIMAGHVDRGSMAYLLSTPNSRIKIAATQALFSLASITAFFIALTLFGIVISEGMFPGELEIGKFILLNVYALLMYFAIGGIGFFASCIAGESKHSLGLGIGIPVGFFLLQLLGGAGEQLGWIGNLSLYALFDPGKLIEGAGFAYAGMVSFALLALALYAGGIAIFNKRDLHV